MRAARSWALQIYLAVFQALTPIWRRVLQHRLKRGKETPQSLAQKWVTHPAERAAGIWVWGHAVGVGEAMALAGLFAQMGKTWPEAHFLITTTARTSGDALHKTGLPPRCLHQFAPIDTPDTVAKFLDHWQPALAVWCEMDLWPALIDATAQRQIPHVLVNARLSAAALAKRRWGRFIYRALLPGFSRIWAQNAESRQGLIQLGALPEQVVVTGTIKAMSPPLACDPVDLAAWRQGLGDRPVWLMASSHPGEEALALQAHALLCRQFEQALLIIVPRAPARGPEVQGLCTSLALLRSASKELPSPKHSVYVADTIGEMGLWYRLAPVAMVGGSWATVGGHNPHEPQALGCQVVHGPNVWNFSESYTDLDAQGESQLAMSPEDIAQAVRQVWAAPEQGPKNQTQTVSGPLESLIQLAKT